MAAKLAVHYDRQADILYLTTRPSYPEQETEELGDDIVAHLLSAELRPSAASRADSLGLLRTRQSAARRLQRLVRQSPFAAYRSCRVKDPAERFVDGFG